MCCTTLRRSRKKPCFEIWIPRTFGTWLSTITRPMPALKPVSTGEEMSLATNPRCSSRASSSIAPTSAVSVAVPVTSFAGSPSGTTRLSCVPARIASVLVELKRRQDNAGNCGRHRKIRGRGFQRCRHRTGTIPSHKARNVSDLQSPDWHLQAQVGPNESASQLGPLGEQGRSVTAIERDPLRPKLAYSVEKLDSRISASEFGGLKPSPDQFAWH